MPSPNGLWDDILRVVPPWLEKRAYFLNFHLLSSAFMLKYLQQINKGDTIHEIGRNLTTLSIGNA